MKHTSRSKSAAVNDIDIDITDILGHKYRYRIDIGQRRYRPISTPNDRREQKCIDLRDCKRYVNQTLYKL